MGIKKNRTDLKIIQYSNPLTGATGAAFSQVINGLKPFEVDC